MEDIKAEARETIERLYEGYREQKDCGDTVMRDMFANRMLGAIEVYETVFGETVKYFGGQVRYEEKGV